MKVIKKLLNDWSENILCQYKKEHIIFTYPEEGILIKPFIIESF